MYPVTCGDLVRRVRQRACLETTSGTVTFGPSFMPDTEVIDNVNTSIGKWWDLVQGTTFAGQFNRNPWNITTVQGQSLYSLAPNFARQLSVDAYIVGNLTPISASPYQEENRNLWGNLTFTGWVYGQPILYQIQGQNISFRPFPQGSQTVTVNYIATAPTVSSSDDCFDSINAWEEFIVLDAAIKCALKDGQLDLIQTLQGLKEEERQRILAAAPMRDQGSPEQIHQTRPLEWSEGDEEGYGGGFW